MTSSLSDSLAAVASRPDSLLRWDDQGLLRGVAYQYREDGSIDWRRLIEPKYLVVKAEYKDDVLARFGVQSLAEVDVTQVPDHQLLVLLGGWKRLLFIRGYLSLSNPCTFVSPEKAVATCTITFAPTYETRGVPVTYSWTASASYANTSGDIAQSFLESTACNRAFSLCLRGFLNISIVGKDEVGPSVGFRRSAAPALAAPLVSADAPPARVGFKGNDTLAKRCAELKVTFEKLREVSGAKYKAELIGDPSTWTSFADVADLDSWVLLDKLTKAPSAKVAAKA